MMASKDTGAGLDVIVIGGGHNGLVAAGYLAKAGLKVAVLEARDILGGPCGAIEFLSGFRSAITNSPGSFEPRILRDLDLEGHGLRFHRSDPNVVHAFPEGCFIGWRDREAVAAQLDAFAPGEAARYNSLLSRLEELGRHLGVSVFEPSRSLAEMARNIPLAQERLFEQVFLGSLRELLDENLRSEQAKALLGMFALNATLAPPSAPGTAIGLMMRPIHAAQRCADRLVCRSAAWVRSSTRWKACCAPMARRSIPTLAWLPCFTATVAPRAWLRPLVANSMPGRSYRRSIRACCLVTCSTMQQSVPRCGAKLSPFRCGAQPSRCSSRWMACRAIAVCRMG
jgi:hypothetical protein